MTKCISIFHYSGFPDLSGIPALLHFIRLNHLPFDGQVIFFVLLNGQKKMRWPM
jgi:hypothetical protein